MERFRIPAFEYRGIKKITIPKNDFDFGSVDAGWEIIKKYLPAVLSAHQRNADKITYLYNYFLGEQDILEKERPYKHNRTNNNRETENHANRQVEFKVGFTRGEQRDYTNKLDTETDELIYLDRYFTDVNFFGKDSDLAEWIYTTGIGVTHTAPRRDIIIADGVDEITGKERLRYATKTEGYDPEYEAPFDFDVVDPRENFIVYSSSRQREPLFCVSFVEIELDNDTNGLPMLGKRLLVETRYAYYIFDSDKYFHTFYWDDENSVEKYAKGLHYLPLIEFSCNKDRLGIVEKNRSCFNTINLIRSTVNDMAVDNANGLLVFKNVDMESEEIKSMLEGGAIIIGDNKNTDVKVDLERIDIQIPYDRISAYLDQVIQNAYDIAGVPLASGQVTSGGDTGQARLLGGGWNNAYTIAHKEIQTFLGYDYDQLKLFLLICKQVPDCPIKTLFASQIDINYRINQNDNYMVKTQGMKYLYDMHCDLEFILKTGGLSNDIKSDKKSWQASIDRYNAEQLRLNNQNQTEVNETVMVEETSDVNS